MPVETATSALCRALPLVERHQPRDVGHRGRAEGVGLSLVRPQRREREERDGRPTAEVERVLVAKLAEVVVDAGDTQRQVAPRGTARVEQREDGAHESPIAILRGSGHDLRPPYGEGYALVAPGLRHEAGGGDHRAAGGVLHQGKVGGRDQRVAAAHQIAHMRPYGRVGQRIRPLPEDAAVEGGQAFQATARPSLCGHNYCDPRLCFAAATTRTVDKAVRVSRQHRSRRRGQGDRSERWDEDE